MRLYIVALIGCIMFVGCTPGKRCCGAELPQSTLALPQTTLVALAPSTLPGDCPVNGPGCQCGCVNGLPCTCAKEKVGVAGSYDEALECAKRTGCRVVSFINQPARAVPGCISYRADPKDDHEVRIWVGTPAGGKYIEGRSGNDAILWTLQPRPVYNMTGMFGECKSCR